MRPRAEEEACARGWARGDGGFNGGEGERERGESVHAGTNCNAGFRGNPQVRAAPSKAGRHDSDQGAVRAVEDEGLVDEGGVGGEAVDPCAVAHDEDGRGAGLVVGGLGCASEERGHAEEFKRAGSDVVAVKALGAFAGAVKNVEAGTADDAVKGMILGDIVEEFGPGENGSAARLILLSVVNYDRDESAGVRIREGLHHDVLDDAEDGRGGADAEGESDGGDDREGRALAEVAEGEADVLAERAHEGPPDGKKRLKAIRAPALRSSDLKDNEETQQCVQLIRTKDVR